MVCNALFKEDENELNCISDGWQPSAVQSPFLARFKLIKLANLPVFALQANPVPLVKQLVILRFKVLYLSFKVSFLS